MNTNDTAPSYPGNNRRDESLSDVVWEAIDAAMRQLEEAWRHAPQPDIGSLVPPAENPLRLRELMELIKADQECRWKSGIPTKIEEYLHDWPELLGQVHVILELLGGECLTRAMFGAMPTYQELRSRFPDLAEQVDLSRIAAIVRDGG
jgi:hypothetical protein